MNNTSAFSTSLKTVPSKAEGIALCSAFVLTSFFIVAGNLLTIIFFAVNKRLRKKSLFLVINMAFADLMLGTICLPIYVYNVGDYFQLWTNQLGIFPSSVYYTFIDTTFTQASLISAVFISCERFYAIYWPLKHRTSMRAYRIVVSMTWIVALLDSALLTGLWHSVSTPQYSMFFWVPYTLILTFIICGCNIGIWRKFQRGNVALQQNRAAQNKRITKTLLFVSVISLLCWLPLVTMNILITVSSVSLPLKFYFMANVLNYSNSFVNPVVYALRIPQFRQALGLCCIRRGTAMNTKRTKRRDNMAAPLTPATELRTLRSDPKQLKDLSQQDVMETDL